MVHKGKQAKSAERAQNSHQMGLSTRHILDRLAPRCRLWGMAWCLRQSLNLDATRTAARTGSDVRHVTKSCWTGPVGAGAWPAHGGRRARRRRATCPFPPPSQLPRTGQSFVPEDASVPCAGGTQTMWMSSGTCSPAAALCHGRRAWPDRPLESVSPTECCRVPSRSGRALKTLTTRV